MHFHDLRHSHKTWLIEDAIPEIAQARRLGHRLAGVRGIYSHVTPATEQAIADVLQHRWTTTSMRSATLLPQPWDLNDPDLAA
jgi:integrase